MDNDRLIAELETCGWFSDLSSSETLALARRIDKHESGSIHPLLASFVIDDPERIGGGTSLMEHEDPNVITSYEELLKAYSGASGGAFSPDSIVEENNEDGEHFTIGFLAGDRIYALFIPGFPQFDLEINDLVNEALSDAGVERRFFVLPTTDTSLALAFIKPAVFECACQMGIIPLQEDLYAESYREPIGPISSEGSTETSLPAATSLIPA